MRILTHDSDIDLLVVTERPVSRKERLAQTQDLFPRHAFARPGNHYLATEI